jgi:hypothetical protein
LPLLLQWLARERNWAQTRGSVRRRTVDCALLKSVNDYTKFAICGPHEIRMIEGHTWIEHEIRVGFRVYINSNRRDSQI